MDHSPVHDENNEELNYYCDGSFKESNIGVAVAPFTTTSSLPALEDDALLLEPTQPCTLGQEATLLDPTFHLPISALNNIPPEYLDFLSTHIETMKKRHSPCVAHLLPGYPPDTTRCISEPSVFTDMRLRDAQTPPTVAPQVQYPPLAEVARSPGMVNMQRSPRTFQKQIFQAASNLGTAIASLHQGCLPNIVTSAAETTKALNNLVSSHVTEVIFIRPSPLP